MITTIIDHLSIVIVKFDNLQTTGVLERSVEIPSCAIHLRDNSIVGEALADARGDIIWGCLPTCAIDNFAVRELDLNISPLLLCQPIVPLRLTTIPDGNAGVQKIRGWLELRYLPLLGLSGLLLGL